MTVQAVRVMAKELAGVFYEDNRSPRFRAAFPTLKHYMRGQWVQSDGSIKLYRPGWLHHVELARKVMATQLGQPDSRITPHMKEVIFDALIEDRNRSLKPQAKSLFQAGMSDA